MANDDINARIEALGKQVELEETLVSLEERLKANRAAGIDLPWWRSPKAVTTLGAIIAAVIPLNTAIQGWWTSYRDLQTRQLNQSHEVRRAYIDRVLDPNLGAEDRKLIFEILAEFDDEPALQSWAQKNLHKETDRLKALEAERKRLAKEAQDARLELVAAKSALDSAAAESERKGEELNTLKARIEASTKAVDDAVEARQQVDAKIVGSRNAPTAPAAAPITYRLYVQVLKGGSTQAAAELTDRLMQAAGPRIVLPAPVERLDQTGSVTLRYFRSEDEHRALALVGCLNRVGLTRVEIVSVGGARSAVRPGHFELWLGPEFKAPQRWDQGSCDLPP